MDIFRMLYRWNELLPAPVNSVCKRSDSYYLQQEGFEYPGVPLKINIKHQAEALSRHM